MNEQHKQVRVDNWGVFFLQRLQMFFSKTDYCDLTLQFEGNVQLKVHRLVMNACTEYFDFLERSCPALEENVILMPDNLQADVIVPIVNFIYTGMLEFHMSMYDRLYKAADLMSINVLTKLLDAQKNKAPRKKLIQSIPQERKPPPKQNLPKELPVTLPGRKLPVWKRKVLPVPSATSTLSSSLFTERWNSPQEHISSIPNNAPKPTRFEWPDDDLPSLSLMDTSIDEISYTSKPLLTQEEEIKASTSFDHLRNSVSSNISPKSHSGQAKKQTTPPALDIEEIKDYIKEQKIRTELAAFEEEIENEQIYENSNKRKLDTVSKLSPKKIRIEKENKETTISITSKGADLDHNKIVADILKKYPHLVKRNKNIRLKIIATGGGNKGQNTSVEVTPQQQKKVLSPAPAIAAEKPSTVQVENRKVKEGETWVCNICAESGEHIEYHMFYMYRKHMTDLHNQQFDDNLCKFCGHLCVKNNVLLYHMFTKHGVKAPKGVVYPRCNQCPYIAISNASLSRHKQYHSKNEIQCADCQLPFISNQSFTRHLQITGHTTNMDRSKDIFDCQFCTKKYSTSANLFAHVKDYHCNEAKRDGIILIDDDPDDDDSGDSTAVDYEPEQNKLKILSNLKVGCSQNSSGNLEASSEAEALSNVASGIATSLGLVDIVVLDENQQYILQQSQQQQDGQTEFILPNLGSNEDPYNAQVQQSDMPSTDELVMVLTDHDYQDGHDNANVDNSNIVVLYSHPVDGQQGQFITSQGNLMVNSETGLLEIRNGNSTTATTSQQLMTSEGPIESIEMIQREIESHHQKETAPTYYEDDNKTTPHQDVIEQKDLPHEVEATVTAPTTEMQQEECPTEEEPKTTADTTDSTNPQFSVCEPMEIDDIPEPKTEEVPPTEIPDDALIGKEEAESQQQKQIEESDDLEKEDTSNIIQETIDDEQDVTPDMLREPTNDAPNVPLDQTEPETNKQDNKEEGEYVVPEDYAMEVDGKINLPKDTEICQLEETAAPSEELNEDKGANETTVEADAPKEQTDPEENPEKDSTEHAEEPKKGESDVETKESVEVEHEPEEMSQSATESQNDQSETSNSQFVDDSSQTWQDCQDTTAVTSETDQRDAEEKEKESSMKNTILDDWEDTDSQQSEQQKAAIKDAEERVNKLMDDWEDEEEEDCHKKESISDS